MNEQEAIDFIKKSDILRVTNIKAREAVRLALEALEKQVAKKPRFIMNRSDTVSLWECVCGKPFKTTHKSGVLDGTDVNYCKHCGQKLDWSDEE